MRPIASAEDSPRASRSSSSSRIRAVSASSASRRGSGAGGSGPSSGCWRRAARHRASKHSRPTSCPVNSGEGIDHDQRRERIAVDLGVPRLDRRLARGVPEVRAAVVVDLDDAAGCAPGVHLGDDEGGILRMPARAVPLDDLVVHSVVRRLRPGAGQVAGARRQAQFALGRGGLTPHPHDLADGGPVLRVHADARVVVDEYRVDGADIAGLVQSHFVAPVVVGDDGALLNRSQTVAAGHQAEAAGSGRRGDHGRPPSGAAEPVRDGPPGVPARGAAPLAAVSRGDGSRVCSSPRRLLSTTRRPIRPRTVS